MAICSSVNCSTCIINAAFSWSTLDSPDDEFDWDWVALCWLWEVLCWGAVCWAGCDDVFWFEDNKGRGADVFWGLIKAKSYFFDWYYINRTNPVTIAGRFCMFVAWYLGSTIWLIAGWGAGCGILVTRIGPVIRGITGANNGCGCPIKAGLII